MTDRHLPEARPIPQDANPQNEQLRSSRQAYFDNLYAQSSEPWEYSRFAAEILRHDYVANVARSLGTTPPRRVLDIGCSLGQLTGRIVGLSPELHAMDLSPAAVERAREHCLEIARAKGLNLALNFYAGSATELPFRPEAFDLVLLCDGIISWRLSADERQSVLEQVYRLCRPGGYVILTDALKQAHVDLFIEDVQRSPLEMQWFRPLNDRLWYSLQRALRPVRDRRAARSVLASRGVARSLSVLSRLSGRRGSKHFCIVARRLDTQPGAT